MNKRKSNGTTLPDSSRGESYGNDVLFQDAFEYANIAVPYHVDNVLGVLDSATFELRYGAREYMKSIDSGLNAAADTTVIAGKTLVYGALAARDFGYAIKEEGTESLIMTGEAIAFGTLGVVSDRVFNNYGFPDVVSNESDSNYFNKYSSYFSFLEKGEDVFNKKELCKVFESTKIFSGRKHIFEELFSRYIREYEVFAGLKYDTKLDSVLRNMMVYGDISLDGIFDIISHASYNIHEAKVYFDLLYNMLGAQEFSGKEILTEVKEIMRCWNTGGSRMTKSEATRLEKTVTLLKVKGIEITNENIEKHKGLYVYIPSILSSTHGEDSAAIGLMKGFIRSHRPRQIKGWDKRKRWIQALVGDGQVFPWIRKLTAKVKIFYNRAVKVGPVERVTTAYVRTRNALGDKQMKLFLSHIRKSMPEAQGEIGADEHKDLMMQFYLIEAIFKKIEAEVRVSDGEIEKTPKKRILGFLLGRGKSESIGPFATQAWLLVSRLPRFGKFLIVAGASRYALVSVVVKTAFIYAFYKGVDIGIFFAKQIPIFEKMIRFDSVNGKHNIGASPELQDILISELEGVRQINRDIHEIQKLKRLLELQKRLETNQYNAAGTDEGVELSEEDRYERTLLEKEIEAYTGDIDKEQLGKEIIAFKLEYLRLLEETANDSNRSFSDDYPQSENYPQ